MFTAICCKIWQSDLTFISKLPILSCLNLIFYFTQSQPLKCIVYEYLRWCVKERRTGDVIQYVSEWFILSSSLPFRTRGRSTSLRSTPTPARPSATTVALCSTASYTRAWDVTVCTHGRLQHMDHVAISTHVLCHFKAHWVNSPTHSDAQKRRNKACRDLYQHAPHNPTLKVPYCILYL